MAERVPTCGGFNVPHSAELTRQQLDAAATPVAKAMARVTAELEPRIRAVEALRTAMHRADYAVRQLETRQTQRATPRALARARQHASTARTAFERAASRLEADVTAQLAPGTRAAIERIQREAVADGAAVVGGADRDLDAWIGTGTMRWFYETFRPDCVVDNNNTSVMLRGNEARHSATVYQRLRQSYERLHPRLSVDQPLPREPMGFDDE